jgi:hypothetical protein
VRELLDAVEVDGLLPTLGEILLDEEGELVGA